MKIVRYEQFDEMRDSMAALLREEFSADKEVPSAVMLPGGATPLPVYKRIQADPVKAGINSYLIVSDERYVSEASDFYNYGKMRDVVHALGMEKDKVLRVNTALDFQEAADTFDKSLEMFLQANGVLSLAVLGLGSDGHTASLFSRRDILDGAGRYAIPVITSEGPDRISVTPSFLSLAERVVVLAAGKNKESIVQQMEDEPATVIAGIALADVENVEVWYSNTGG